ncbi:putative aspergillopepsin [Talaromyces proteolyticus]|uniref:Aspergillopepsin n=1 Tax=Talaromyces proteolyticus TaxID=1131652 RepID=A0AAD4Q0U2_9EURO|nr:putative aspergillopepsin [Talaromyces proteolyticus]KAH8701554.1 putative aspergillopepsin [Talaromyces proteolyticus]
MKISIVTATLVLSGLSLAAPLTEKRMAAKARRATATHHSNPPYVPGSNGVEKVLLTNTTNEQYSSNWAGAVLISTGYSSVTAEFVVPKPSAPSGGSSSTQYCASAWVGLDGDTCGTAILQTGVDFCVQGGSPSYDAWYEWYPDYAYDFSGITISAGNTIKITVTASSKTAGKATVENVSTGKTVTHSFSGESAALCEYNAEWIVEDFESGSSLVPFANFGTVTFTGAQATKSGSTVDTSGATIIDIKQNNKVLTSSSASGSTVKVSYV